MKLILTESQYEILENIIKEVAKSFTNSLDRNGALELVTVDGTDRYKVTSVFGSGQYVEVVDKYGSYIFDLGKAFNPKANTFTALKNGRYEAAQTNMKGKIISPQQIVGGSPVTVNNVKKIDIYDPYGDLVDTAYTSIGDEERRGGEDKESDILKQLEKSKGRESEKDSREKRVYDMVMNDPELKKAFYHQPKIFKGLLNVGKSQGIGPAQDLINKYINKYDKRKRGKKDGDIVKIDNDFKKFKVNGNVRFEIINKPIKLSYGEQKLKMNVGETYAARYVGNQYLKGKGFKIYLKEKQGQDIYSGTIKGFFKEVGQSGELDKIVDKMDTVIVKIKDYNY